MTTLPIRPQLKSYRGPDQLMRRRVSEANLLAQKISRHLNERILADPGDLQQHFFRDVAERFNCSEDAVRAAIPAGGYQSLNLRVTEMDRDAIRSELGLGKARVLIRVAGRS